MLMADHGLVLYGNAIMVNPDFAKANPKVVAGFVRATIKGMLDTIKDPDAAIKSVMKRNETGDEKIELDRLKMSLRDNFVTPWVKANGFGGVDMARLAKSIDQIARHLRLQEPAEGRRTSSPAEYLPPAAERKLLIRSVRTSAHVGADGWMTWPVHDRLRRYRRRHADLQGRVGRRARAAGHDAERRARRVRRRGRSVRLRQVVVDEARHRAGAAGHRRHRHLRRQGAAGR